MFSTNLYKFLPKNGQIMNNSCKKKIIHLFLTVSQIYSESQGLVNLLVFYKNSLEFKSKWVSVSSYAAVENTVRNTKISLCTLWKQQFIFQTFFGKL